MALQNPTTTDRSRGRDRDRGDSRFRNAQEAKPKDVYYRKEYGWVMSNKQVEAEKKVKAEYDARVQAAEAQVQQNKERYQQSINEGRNNISGAYDDAIGSSSAPSMDLVPVRVVNGNTVEQTYMLPRSSVSQMSNGSWVDNGQYYNVDVRVDGHVMGEEIHNAMGAAANQVSQAQKDNEALYNQSINNARNEQSEAVSGFEAASGKSYADASAMWDSELNTLRNAYGNRVATGKQQYEDSKAKYNESVMGVDAGLLETPTNIVKPNAAVNNGN
jgi:hypothetical protein